MKEYRSEKELLFEIAVRCAAPTLKQLGLMSQSALLYRIAEYIIKEDDPTLKGLIAVQNKLSKDIEKASE
jgi:hypothetical protein